MNFYEIIILRNIPFHENRECISIILASEEGSFQYEIVKAIDRSIDHFCGDDEMNWNEEKSREENREKNKKKKKRSASNYSCTTDRWKKVHCSLAVCLCLCERKN